MENPTSEDETTEMSTNAFSSPKLITMLTTNSRATLKATVRTTASTKTDRVTTTKIQSTAITEQPRYIFVFKLISKHFDPFLLLFKIIF